MSSGIRIQEQSPAIQSYFVNLTGSALGYLPTSRSVNGGGYGAVPSSTMLGPEGGDELVQMILKIINDVWNSNQ
jgi:hypothetical protein